MDEQFESRPLMDLPTLRALQRRSDGPSSLRLTLHLGTFGVLFGAVIANADNPLRALLFALALGWVWAGLFAPFHECVHATAFKTPRLNVIGSWLTGVPFLMSPLLYRTFHFEHHRHTQNIDKDPELAGDPRYQHWPTGLKNWLHMALAIGLIKLKVIPLLGFCFKPREQWQTFAKWEKHIPDAHALVQSCRLVLAAWVVFIAAALLVLPGGWWLIFAAWLSHVWQTLWVACEHTGLPLAGSILLRTRTVISNRFVRWWIWNMNYHAEHHAWPSIPWHQLPATHGHVAEQLGSCVPGYAALHNNIMRARNTPSCDPI